MAMVRMSHKYQEWTLEDWELTLEYGPKLSKFRRRKCLKNCWKHEGSITSEEKWPRHWSVFVQKYVILPLGSIATSLLLALWASQSRDVIQTTHGLLIANHIFHFLIPLLSWEENGLHHWHISSNPKTLAVLNKKWLHLALLGTLSLQSWRSHSNCNQAAFN